MVMSAQRALRDPSAITQEYLGVTESWLGHLTAALFNVSIWLLWIGVFLPAVFRRKHLIRRAARRAVICPNRDSVRLICVST